MSKKQFNDEYKEIALPETNTQVNAEENAEQADARYYDQFIEGKQLGRLYEITIYFRNMPLIKEIYDFLNDELEDGIIILDIKVNYARLLWSIDDWEDPGDIQNAMYYLLDDVRLGEYEYSYVDTYYNTIRKNRIEDVL